MKVSLALMSLTLLAMAAVAKDNESGVVVVSDPREGRLIGKKLALLALIGKGLLGSKTVGAAGAAGAAGIAGTAGLAGSVSGNKQVIISQPTPPILVLESKTRVTYYPTHASVVAHPHPASSYYVVGTAHVSAASVVHAPVHASKYVEW